jgi:hypothetical protein
LLRAILRSSMCPVFSFDVCEASNTVSQSAGFPDVGMNGSFADTMHRVDANVQN